MKTLENLSEGQKPITVKIYKNTYLNIHQEPEVGCDDGDTIALGLRDIPALLRAIAEEASLEIEIKEKG